MSVASPDSPEILAARELTHINSLADLIDQPPAQLVAGLRRLWEIAESNRQEAYIHHRLLTWNVCKRYFAFILEGSGQGEAAALCFLRESLISHWLHIGRHNLDLAMEDEEKYPLSVYGVFAIGVEMWMHRRRKNFRDQVMAEAKKDPRYLVWAITLLEREESGHYGRRSVQKQEIEQKIIVRFEEKTGNSWVSGTSAPVREFAEDDVIPTALLPARPRREDEDAEDA